MKRSLAAAAMVTATLHAAPVFAHHGVASLGAAGLEGPGAPIETSSSATLPAGGWLASYKLDFPKYKTFDPDPANPESDYNHFHLLGVGYGFSSWLSAYAFLPYTKKADEAGGFTSTGVGDLGLNLVAGFKHDGAGFSLIPANESLDELEEWHFTAYAGTSLPTGDADVKDPSTGANDPGKATGFGKPTVSLGATTTKMLTPKLTATFEAGALYFRKRRYDDDGTGTPFEFQYGLEKRLNAALSYRLHADAGRKLRVDGNIELNYLVLGRDKTNGVGELATGGRILYAVPGVRVSVDRMSFAAGIKKPIAKRLNEEAQQQGAEGVEKYRLILSASMLF
jgi:hypothetical protein